MPVNLLNTAYLSPKTINSILNAELQNQLNSSKHKNRKTKKLRNQSYRALYLSQSVAILRAARIISLWNRFNSYVETQFSSFSDIFHVPSLHKNSFIRSPPMVGQATFFSFSL